MSAPEPMSDFADAGRRSALLEAMDVGQNYGEVATARVLVVDDERKIRDVVGSYLAREGYSVMFAETGEAALDIALREHPDLVVLDLKLPDLAGEEVARAVREVSQLPIIMLTAKSSEADRIAGLGLGADDYLVKPFSVRELAARVAAVLRRTRGVRSELSFDGGRLVIDQGARAVRLDGQPRPLTRTEADLLLALLANSPRVLSREQLLTAVRGFGSEPDERTIDAHVKNLRRKLGDPRHPRYILTAAGIGYRFGLEPDA
jgi:two-component system, OmpR family, response regulator RegX3